jgi:hypothetical protein
MPDPESGPPSLDPPPAGATTVPPEPPPPEQPPSRADRRERRAVLRSIARVRRLERGPGPRFHRWLGLGLVVLALALVLDPDYPPRRSGAPDAPSARPGPLAPALVAVQPEGVVARAELAFEWRCSEPIACRILILDREFVEIAALEPASANATRAVPDQDVLDRLRTGEEYSWVAAEKVETRHRRTTPPMRFVVRD